MLLRPSAVLRMAHRASLAVFLVTVAAVLAPTAHAQVFTNQRAVGGVMLATDGMIRAATVAERGRLRAEAIEALQMVPGEMAGLSEMRKVSLKGLDAALRQSAASGEPIPDAVQCLAGLQQIRYVLVYPEQNDILLVGPGEGWRVAEDGTVVGLTTGRPVLLLDDLLVAFRAIHRPTPSVISCSIDPTAQGRQRVQAYMKRLPPRSDPRQAAAMIAQELGPQEIRVEGVPATSHFAAVMVAADYRMKQIGMGFVQAPVAGLPSFPEMVSASGRNPGNLTPRWWLEPDYGTVLSDEDGLTWEITAAGIKTMSEGDFFDAQGERKQSGRADPVSRKWADAMTARYADLAVAEPVFGQLQGCMDLAVAVTLIVRKDLLVKAGCELPMMVAELPTGELAAPRSVAANASVARTRGGWMIASGGVQIDPWAIIDRSQTRAGLEQVRDRVAMANDSGWWSD